MSSQLPPFEKGDINALPSKVQTYISDYAEILKPKNIHICDGSTEENTSLIDLLTKLGTCVPFAKHDNW
jgi:phosphoenolpyruvate carboxykinase (GTP)